jgi:hypothetical protein
MSSTQYDVLFYFPKTTDHHLERYKSQVYNLWAPLMRIGLRVNLISTEQLFAGEYVSAKVLILPRNERMQAGVLQFIQDSVIPAGVHVVSDGDLPGLYDEYIRPQPDFAALMSSLFGITPTTVNLFQDVSSEYNYKVQRSTLLVSVQGVT